MLKAMIGFNKAILALVLFKDGQPVQQIVGVKPKEENARIIESNL